MSTKQRLPQSDPTPSEFEELDALVSEWVPLPDIAEAMDVVITRVHSMVDEGAVLVLRNPHDRVRRVPAEFLNPDRTVLDPLAGTVSVLRDAGFTDVEATRWLLQEDDSLPGRPIDMLHAGRKTEIRRRAQALAW